MYDARIFLDSIKSARAILEQHNAIHKGDYAIHDIIYASRKAGETLDKVFLRLRLIPKNIWNEKSVIVAIKNTEIQEVGKRSIVPVKKEFDAKDEAEVYIKNNYEHQFEYSYEFDRSGSQYDLGQDQIDLEDIEGNYSIEFKSPTQEGLQKLLQMFNVKEEDIIKGPSVVAIKRLLEGN